MRLTWCGAFFGLRQGHRPAKAGTHAERGARAGAGWPALDRHDHRGQLDRGIGLLNNTVYVGQLSWNRCSYIKDPRTRKRVARVNPKSQWEIIEVPELRIVDQALCGPGEGAGG